MAMHSAITAAPVHPWPRISKESTKFVLQDQDEDDDEDKKEIHEQTYILQNFLLSRCTLTIFVIICCESRMINTISVEVLMILYVPGMARFVLHSV